LDEFKDYGSQIIIDIWQHVAEFTSY